MEHFLHSYRSQTHNALEQEFTGKEKEQENRARGAPISGVDGKRRQGKECRKHQVSKVWLFQQLCWVVGVGQALPVPK